jgi:CheY-like chemotaxis protein
VQQGGHDPGRVGRWSDVPPGDPHRDVNGALHDVSNALTVLLGWVDEARSGRASGEQLDRALAIVEHRARAARDLARRAIGAHVSIDDRDEALDFVVAEVVEALSVEAQREAVRLQISRRCPGVRVGMAEDLSQVLTNMVLNALAWAPPGTAVTLESATDAGGASILVRDQGPGVATAQASHIFDGASTRHGGAGVGLKHARAIARAAGGDLELVNDGSPGASFRVRWRRAEPPPAPLSAPRAAVLAGTRVLIVEDDVDVATLLESALGARGAQVVVARTAAELDVRALEEHDAALVDLSPIAHDVRGAVQALRRGSPDAVLVFISGSATGLPDELAGEAVRWVRKPFEVGEIVAALLGSGGPRGSEPPPPPRR